MDDPLSRLIRDLRTERCPDSVLERVARRVGRDPVPAAGSSRVRPLALAFGGVALGVVLLVGWLWRSSEPAGHPVHLAQSSVSERARVLEQTHGALVAIGQVLIDAGTRAEKTLLEETVPPLVDSFRTAQDKLNQAL